MKIRNGFVSNSSSSSFICDICKENVSGMDMGLEDAGMFECVVGHIVCDNHLITNQVKYYDLDLEGKREYCLARATSASSATKEIIKNTEHEDELDDLYSDEIQYEERYNTPVDSCPCCTLDKPTDPQVIKFLLSEVKTTREEVVKQMKNRFENYAEMCKKLGI